MYELGQEASRTPQDDVLIDVIPRIIWWACFEFGQFLSDTEAPTGPFGLTFSTSTTFAVVVHLPLRLWTPSVVILIPSLPLMLIPLLLGWVYIVGPKGPTV